MKKWLVAMAVVAAAAIPTGCEDDRGDGLDAVQELPGNDLVFGDTCSCRAVADCEGQVPGVGACSFASCEACSCVLKYRAAATACNDQDAKTLHDVCDGKGVCAGKPANCGDGTCEGEENCENCTRDCGCKDATLWCWEKTCQARPVKGNGKCEPGENCQDTPGDCGCKVGQTACVEKQCKACADFCTAMGQDCGTSQGCACGTCDEGWLCSESLQCYNPAMCNDDNCDATENCGSCPSDCGCTTGQACHAAKCVSCADFCLANGKDCGFFGGCDCGPDTVCHDCKNNVLTPDCKCLRYPESKKQCGEIEGCLLGPLDGACPEGKECVNVSEGTWLCLENCETLCAGKECGWATDCICDWCWGSDVCQANACVPGTEEPDSYEPNEDYDTASDLGSTTDNDTTSAQDIEASIHDPYDFDWYKIYVDDVFGETMQLVLTLEGFGEDKDLDIAVCYECDSGLLAGAGLEPVDAVFELEEPLIPDTRCFASVNLWGAKEEIRLKPTCPGGQEDSGTVYFFVLGAEEYDYGPSYHLKFHF